MIQQIAEMMVATPFLMSAIADLEAAHETSKKDQDEITAAKTRAVIARQTIVRTSIFVVVAAFVTMYKVKGGMRDAVSEIRRLI